MAIRKPKQEGVRINIFVPSSLKERVDNVVRYGELSEWVREDLERRVAQREKELKINYRFSSQETDI